MAIRVQRHANVSKQATLLDELDVSPLKWRVCGCGLNRFVHEGMNHISNVKVHLKTRSGNVNIQSMNVDEDSAQNLDLERPTGYVSFSVKTKTLVTSAKISL